MHTAISDRDSLQELKLEVAVICMISSFLSGVLKGSSLAPGFIAGGRLRFFTHSPTHHRRSAFTFTREGVVNAAQFGEARFQQKFRTFFHF